MAGEQCVTSMWLSPLALIVVLQLITASASIGRVATTNYILARGYSTVALGAIAADFAIKYFWTRQMI